MKERILIVEDDRPIGRLLTYNFERAGWSTVWVVSGEDALRLLDRETVSLVVLDVMLPRMDGFETCRRIRSDTRFRVLPIIFLSARGAEVDRVVGLELGADDYVVKPFSPRELVLRVRRLLNRRPPPESVSVLEGGGVVVDPARHRVEAAGRTVALTSMEFKLLVLLLRRRGRVQGRERLLMDVWGRGADVHTRTVDAHIKSLRRKLGAAGVSIETVRGHGYRFREAE